ncbi:MAG: photosynthetic reaction center subunit H [Gammaproteobacteria bacterium]
MGIGEIDLVEIVFTLFWLFFAGLIIYIRKEDKREGYPLESDRSDRSRRVAVVGFPSPGATKEFKTLHDGIVKAPRNDPDRELAAKPAARYPGAPLVPTGNPLVDGVGPAAWSDRADVPDKTLHGDNRIVPMRVAKEFVVAAQDPDPRGMDVIGCDGEVAGVVADIWVDLGEPMIVFLEVDLGAEHGNKHVLLPAGFVRYKVAQRQVQVQSIYAHQFVDVPALASPDQVTLLEEDKLYGYYAGGKLYADASRQEPLI